MNSHSLLTTMESTSRTAASSSSKNSIQIHTRNQLTKWNKRSGASWYSLPTLLVSHLHPSCFSSVKYRFHAPPTDDWVNKSLTGVEEWAASIVVVGFDEGAALSSFCLWDTNPTLTGSPISMVVSVPLAGTDSESTYQHELNPHTHCLTRNNYVSLTFWLSTKTLTTEHMGVKETDETG